MEKGKSTEQLEWWQTAIIYQIYPRSFYDSNGDGIGDLKGIQHKLDYFEYLNVKAIWISPFCKSPMCDFGYDISDFCDVDPIFGSLKDFDDLVENAHRRGIKIIVDFVPNHTSDQHDWFQRSCRREPPYDDYYIWRDAEVDAEGRRQPPNNWLSVFGGSAWRWHEGREQYYYTAFLPGQPDLNYRNPKVVEEMKDVVRFWMEHGADGLRVDAVEQLFEVEDTSLNEPRSDRQDLPPIQYEYLDHIYTSSQPEIADIVRGWRDVLDQFRQQDGQTRFMVIETYTPPEIRSRYFDCGVNPFNMDLVDELKAPLSGDQLELLVDREYSHLPQKGWPSFVLGNHDRKRIADKFDARYTETLNMLLLTLRGTPTCYYGDELGMKGITVSFDETQDPWGKNFGPERYVEFSRDPVRSPMQWDNSVNAGFSANPSPWLPVHPNYLVCNVKAQKESTAQTSLQLFAALARLREDPAFQQGLLRYAVTHENVFSYIRHLPSQTGSEPQRYLVILNIGQEASTDDYSGAPVMCAQGVVVLCTTGLSASLRDREVLLSALQTSPGDGLIIKLL